MKEEKIHDHFPISKATILSYESFQGNMRETLVDVAFQELSIIHLTRGNAPCLGGNPDLQHRNESYHQSDGSDWSSDDIDQAGQHTVQHQDINVKEESVKLDMNCLRVFCSNENDGRSAMLTGLFKVMPTVYCIECVAMITPIVQVLSQQMAGVNTPSFANNGPNMLENMLDNNSSRDGGGKFINKKNPPLISAGLRSWKIWRRYSDFYRLEESLVQRYNSIFNFIIIKHSMFA